MKRTYEEWLKYYENATKEQVIEDTMHDMEKIQRLNNIIDELEKWMETERDYYFENYYYSDFNAYGSKLNDVLDKLKELKEGNK